jgi:hypothetical protein
MISCLSGRAFARVFARANVLEVWPGPSGRKGAAFPLALARAQAVRLRRRFYRGRVVLLLGHRVAAAFGVRASYLTRVVVGGADVFVLPHPSGVNRWYNDAANVARLGRLLRGFVAHEKEIGDGE